MASLHFDSGALLRSALESDRADLYRVCLETGDSGADATQMYALREMLGEIYVGAYLTFDPSFTFALVDDDVSGYVLGAFDTTTYEERFEIDWLPMLLRKYASVDPTQFTSEETGLINFMKNPVRTPVAIAKEFPSQIHIDIVEKSQGKGYGKAMMQHLMKELASAGSPGAHLHMSPTNTRAYNFYLGLGFDLAHKSDNEWLMTKKF